MPLGKLIRRGANSRRNIDNATSTDVARVFDRIVVTPCKRSTSDMDELNAMRRSFLDDFLELSLSLSTGFGCMGVMKGLTFGFDSAGFTSDLYFAFSDCRQICFDNNLGFLSRKRPRSLRGDGGSEPFLSFAASFINFVRLGIFPSRKADSRLSWLLDAKKCFKQRHLQYP